ncbi:c-type cytochrome [Cerasicoccus fimbriatus]|uniref:c-type cytochrome n=1 Tax=Cerasicoccus fimbriatus TaxID=3014554 RepID=UPI0022B57D28|nr:cytochrome c [Cerasicoccus sp. TK19100]
MKSGVVTFYIIAALLMSGCGERSSGDVPSKPAPPPKPIALDNSVKTGEELYALHCLSCHGEQGQGVAEVFPPLAGSPRLLSAKNFAHGLIHGFPRPSDPNGSPWMGEMPKFSHLSDEDLAKLSTYARQTWGNATDVVTVEIVAEQRAQP